MNWKFRPQRGSLADAMAEAIEVDGFDGLMRHLVRAFSVSRLIHKSTVRVEPYGVGPFAPYSDDRIGWKNVHIVTLEGYGPLGFADLPLDEVSPTLTLLAAPNGDSDG